MQPSAPAQAPQVVDRLPEPKAPSYEEVQAKEAADERKRVEMQADAATRDVNSSSAKAKRDTYVRTSPTSNYLGS